MLEAVLAHLNNWFTRQTLTKAWRVEGGVLDVPVCFLSDGQWFRVQGSVFNDGLFQWPCEGMHDEEFHGTVQALAVPDAVVKLADDIEKWCGENGDAQAPYQSESFGGYTYTKATDGSQTWQGAFRHRLNRWRKL